MFDFIFNASKNAMERLDPMAFKAKIDRALHIASLQAGNIYAENIQEKVYSNPPSPRYVRTGSALRGREVKKVQDGYKLVGDSRLGGATKNYSMFLNKNSRIKKLNTLFFEKTKDDIKKFKKETFKKIVKL